MPMTFPYTLTNLLGGPARILWALAAQTRPTKIDDIIGMATPYTAKAGWNEFGATNDASGYSREIETDEIEIEQAGVVLEKVSTVTRSITVPISEINAANMQIAEAAPASTSISVGAGGSGTPAQSRLDVGQILTLPRYRIAIIAERDSALGSSGEGGARGLLAAIVLYSASVSADASDLEVARGDLVGREVTFRGFADSAVTDPLKAHGAFIFETGATVP